MRQRIINFYDKKFEKKPQELESVKKSLEANLQLPQKPVKSISITFTDRQCANKLLYTLYSLVRILYVSVWFYTAPFLAIIL